MQYDLNTALSSFTASSKMKMQKPNRLCTECYCAVPCLQLICSLSGCLAIQACGKVICQKLTLCVGDTQCAHTHAGWMKMCDLHTYPQVSAALLVWPRTPTIIAEGHCLVLYVFSLNSWGFTGNSYRPLTRPLREALHIPALLEINVLMRAMQGSLACCHRRTLCGSWNPFIHLFPRR